MKVSCELDFDGLGSISLVSKVLRILCLLKWKKLTNTAGTFGKVLECLDNEKKEIVAIKIVRSIHKYREAALIEIDVLQKLCRHDIGGQR